MQRSADIHHALVSVMPQHKRELDLNLNVELNLIRRQQSKVQHFVGRWTDTQHSAPQIKECETVAVAANLTTTPCCLD